MPTIITHAVVGSAAGWAFASEGMPHNGRYFFPFRPIAVSPIGAGAFFTERGMKVMASEVVWVWLPVLAGAAGWRAVGRRLGWTG